MSSAPVRCEHCHAAIVAKTRPSERAKRLRAMPDLAYGEPSRKPGVVVVLCPGCGKEVDIPGRLVIEQSAA